MSVFSSRGRPFRRLRAEVLAASNVCWLCGKPGATTVDHLLPRSLGGQDVIENLAPAHHACNARRGDRMGVPRNRTSRDW